MNIRDGARALVDGFRTFRVIPAEPYQDPRKWVNKMMAASEARRLAHLQTLRQNSLAWPTSSTPRLTVDREADAAYLQLTGGPVAETREIAPGLMIDIDTNGNPVGIEILTLSKHADSRQAQPSRVAEK